jgi:hypothetical protein
LALFTQPLDPQTDLEAMLSSSAASPTTLRAAFARGVVVAVLAAAAACTPATAPTPVVSGSSGSSASSVPAASAGFRAVPLVGAHAVRGSLVGPGGRIYVTTTQELLVYTPGDSSSGERVPFEGRLIASPSGSQLYRIEGPELVELDAAGQTRRKATLDGDIRSVTFSRSGGVLAVDVGTQQRGTVMIVVIRGSDLAEVARLPPALWNGSVVTSHDDAYATVAGSVIDMRAGGTIHRDDGIAFAAKLFEDGQLFWLDREDLHIVDLAHGTSIRMRLPCVGAGRASPSMHRFITRCDSETLVTTISTGAPVFDDFETDSYLINPEDRPPIPAPVPQDARFRFDVAGSVLESAQELWIVDGQLVVKASTPRPTPERVVSPRTLGPLGTGAGARVAVVPDVTRAHVVLLDPQTGEAKEHYFFGRNSSTLHVRDDGTFETTGDAAVLENLLLCTDGRRFVPVARCAHR